MAGFRNLLSLASPKLEVRGSEKLAHDTVMTVGRQFRDDDGEAYGLRHLQEAYHDRVHLLHVTRCRPFAGHASTAMGRHDLS